MPGRLSAFLSRDHARLDALLTRATAAATLDLGAYGAFREGLLRHIAMEEKVLLPDARRRRGGAALPVARQLRADHGALAALLVPTPTHALLAKLRAVLGEHNPLEEGPGGLYEVCEALAGDDVDALVAGLEATPRVPVAPHFDDARALDSIERHLRARATLAGG